MNIAAWGLLFAATVVVSMTAFVAKEAPVYSSLSAFVGWLLLAFGATNMEWVSHGDPVSWTEPAVVVFCGFQAAVSLLVLFASVAGEYGANDYDSEGTESATAGRTPWNS